MIAALRYHLPRWASVGCSLSAGSMWIGWRNEACTRRRDHGASAFRPTKWRRRWCIEPPPAPAFYFFPSFGMPACRNRKVVMTQLNLVVRFDFHLISTRGKEVPPGAHEFASFLKSHIATWAGRAGVL